MVAAIGLFENGVEILYLLAVSRIAFAPQRLPKAIKV
jgi:hypothetical protein